MSSRLVLATRNAHKVGELRRILAGTGHLGDVDLVGLDAYPDLPDVVESGVTFAANALLKAHAVAEATGLPAIADDSGLAVDVLGGSPGVFSARWSGRHGDDAANLQLLLAQLRDVPAEHRGARFVCAAALALPQGSGAGTGSGQLVEHGEMAGVLVTEPRGSNGFGYDPIFVADGEDRTNAQLLPDEKDAISHRSKAFRGLAARLPQALVGV